MGWMQREAAVDDCGHGAKEVCWHEVYGGGQQWI